MLLFAVEGERGHGRQRILVIFFAKKGKRLEEKRKAQDFLRHRGASSHFPKLYSDLYMCPFSKPKDKISKMVFFFFRKSVFDPLLRKNFLAFFLKTGHFWPMIWDQAAKEADCLWPGSWLIVSHIS